MLNEKQKQAVEHKDGQLLVVSCPGSGKTTVIVNRARRLIEKGVNPSNIMVITFTKEAALQMQKRYEDLFGPTTIMFGTIHSICFKVIGKTYGYRKENILLATEQWEFFRTFLYQKVSTTDMEEYIKNLMLHISAVRNADINPDEYECSGVSRTIFNSALAAYDDYKKSINKIDFDDMMIICRNIFRTMPNELEYWRNQYRYIMIDEFQDTNGIQADIFYRLAGENGNICVVGDDDQSIYGFRSADSSIMLNFPKEYPMCTIVHMDTNYRSGGDIIKRAEMLIGKNKDRFEKNFNVGLDTKGNVSAIKCETLSHENNKVIRRLSELRAKGIPYNEMAVLYRTNFENQLLIGTLLKYDIPFYTTEAPKDYHQDFIFLDIMAYYRLAEGKELPGDLQRILNRPMRYLKAELFKGGMLKDAYKVCERATNKTGARRQIDDLFADLAMLKGKAPKQFMKYLSQQMKYEDAAVSYCNFIQRDAEGAKAIYEMLEEEAGSFETMQEWKEYADFYAEQLAKKKKEKAKEGICFSTFHSAKGLEWENVIIINANEDACPYRKAITDEDIEEERRLFYVAVTRAKSACDLYYCELSGKKKLYPSRFLEEMGLLKEKRFFTRPVVR